MKRSALIALVVGSAALAQAHGLDIAYLRIEPPAKSNGVVGVSLDLDLGAVALLLEVEPSAVTADFVKSKSSEIAAATITKELPKSPSGACTLGAFTAELVSPSVRVTTTMTCPSGERTWSFPFIEETRVPATFQLLVKEVASDRLTVVERGSHVVNLGEARMVAPSIEKVSTASRLPYLVGGVIAAALMATLWVVTRRRRQA